MQARARPTGAGAVRRLSPYSTTPHILLFRRWAGSPTLDGRMCIQSACIPPLSLLVLRGMTLCVPNPPQPVSSRPDPPPGALERAESLDNAPPVRPWSRVASDPILQTPASLDGTNLVPFGMPPPPLLLIRSHPPGVFSSQQVVGSSFR